MELQADQALDRLVKLSQLLESNCEYMTVVKRCLTDEDILQRDNLPTLVEYLQQKKCKINEQSLFQVFIQVAYFVFSCRRYNIQPQIGKEDIRVQEISFKNMGQKKFSPVIFYKITDEKQLEPFQSIVIVGEIYQFFFAQYAQYLEHFKNEMTQADLTLKNYMDKFKKQVQYLLSDQKVYEMQKQKQFFLCLEETPLFRQFSILLKIKNCSILDSIKGREQSFLKFKECKQKDVDLIIAYGNEKKKPKTDHDKIKEKEKQIQSNITQLFKYLEKVDSNSMEQQNQPREKQQLQKMKIIFKHKERPLQNFYLSVRKFLPGLVQMPAQQATVEASNFHEMEFIIEYSSDRNSICVRLIPNQINIHIENNDFLMYQSNILTFETVNVNIELVETTVEINLQKKTIKKLAFKGTSCLNSKEPPLEKILLLMDAIMIASKICEPQLSSSRMAFGGVSDHERFNIVASKINHYTRIYLKCAKKVYSQ